MKILIPLAGKGSRLRPHTHSKPKPLLHVAGKPLLAHIIDACQEIEFSEMIFVTGHLKEHIESFIKSNYSFPCRFIEQKLMDGSAGAVNVAREFIDEDVLIIYADTIFETDMKELVAVQKNPALNGLIWGKEVEDYQRFGVMVTDTHGILTKIVEKPKEPISKLANIGMYYIKDYKLMFEGIDYIYEKNIKIGKEFFLVDAFSYMIEQGSKIKITSVDGWYDCGTFETILETNRLLLEKHHALHSTPRHSIVIPPVSIGKNVHIDRSVIGPHVSIADDVVIQNSVIQNSIIDDNAQLTNAVLSGSTVGSNTRITGSVKKIHIGDSSEFSDS